MSRNKRKPRIGRVILLFVLLILVAAAGCFGFFIYNLTAPGDGSVEVSYEIAEGEAFDSVLTGMEEENIIRSASAVRLYARITGAGEYYAGLYELNDGMTATEILDTISDSSNAVQESLVLTIPEGKWAKEIAASVHELFPQYETDDILALWNDAEYINTLAADYEFLDAEALNNDEYNVKLEGYLFPETYYLDPDSDLDTITRTLLDQFDTIYIDHKDEFDASEYSVHELITLASIVQFESGSTDDMATIAGVFYNRLDDEMNLESSVTVCYALYDEFDDPLDCETRVDVDSPYNTYLYSGLPIGPILNPGEDAILAVLSPADTNYYFFAADIYGDGTVYFSETLEEHNAVCEELGLVYN